MKRGYSKVLYNQRNKDETIVSVIKRLFGEHLMSRLIRTQNRELSFKCITYNMHRLTNLIILMMFSTKPNRRYCLYKSDVDKSIKSCLDSWSSNTSDEALSKTNLMYVAR